MTITGNAERDQMIMEAINNCRTDGKPPSVANAKAFLPDDFDLLPQEIVAVRRAMQQAPMVTNNPDGHPLAAPQESIDDAAPAEDTPGSVTLPQAPVVDAAPPVITQAQARAAVEKAHKRLDSARVTVKLAQQHVIDTKAKLAKTIEAWQQNADYGTPEERRMKELRAHLAGEQAKRAGGFTRPQPRPGNSVVDRNAAYGRDNSAAGFVRSQMRHGGSHRGAYPKNMQGQQVKLPSSK